MVRNIGSIIIILLILGCTIWANAIVQNNQSQHKTTRGSVKIVDEDGKPHKVDSNSIRGFQNMDGKTYVLYINGSVGIDLLLDRTNLCLVIQAKYGSGTTCYLGGK